MSRNTILKRTRRQLQRLAFGMACVLLSATSHVFADETEELADHMLSAEMALQENRYQEAASEYRKAAEISEDPEVAQQATRIGYSYGFNDDALKSAQRWAKLDEESDEALLYVSQLYLRTGEIRKSQRSFEKLLERGREPADERLLAIIPFLSQEDESLAYELMLKLAKPYKDSAAANYAVAVMALQAGETATAGERAKKASEIEPDWVKPHLLYARSMLLGGDAEGAIDYTQRLVGDDPDPDPEARLELAIMLLSTDRDDDALSQVNQILLEQPQRSDALRLMAIINFRPGTSGCRPSRFPGLAGNRPVHDGRTLLPGSDRRSQLRARRRHPLLLAGDARQQRHHLAAASRRHHGAGRR